MIWNAPYQKHEEESKASEIGFHSGKTNVEILGREAWESYKSSELYFML